MEILAKILSILIALEGALALFMPSTAAEAGAFFRDTAAKPKRMFGGVFLLAGLILLWLTRIFITTTFVHWVIALYGLFIGCCGLFLLIFPGAGASILAWFYAEKGPASLIGAFLLGSGITLFVLI